MSDQEDIAMDDQVDEPKKRRGAPKKAATKVKADVEASDEPPVKRGRGRPPGPGKKAAKTKPAPKPKKQADDEDAIEEGEDEDADKAPPKRRGRPPKAAAKGAKAKAAKAKSESESEQEDEEDDISEHEEAPPAKAKNGKAAAKTAPKNGHSDVDEEADQADEDEDADEGKPDAASSDARIKIVVEHCKSCHTYRRRADDIIDALKEKWSGIEVDYNPKAPRRGSFEINLINDNGEEVPLWSGLKKGPPRKLKFPDPEVVVEKMTKVYDSGKE